MKKAIFCLIAFCLLSACSYNYKKEEGVLFCADNFTFNYKLFQADTVYALAWQLREISGLGYYKKNSLVCVEDETGKAYVFDLLQGNIAEVISFKDYGDFEGVETVKQEIWVLESKGNLFCIKTDEKTKKIQKYNTGLSKKNNAEGLAYDSVKNRLLIACKGFPFITSNNGDENKKAIYAFDIQEKKLSESPAYLIDLYEIKKLKKHDYIKHFWAKLTAGINPAKGGNSFHPSAIAVHPFTSNIYVLASEGNMLIVIRQSGDLLFVHTLPDVLFPQPEGICFDAGGNLYIANEGKNSHASIQVFKPD